jgi:hypothetical protein
LGDQKFLNRTGNGRGDRFAVGDDH